MCRVPKRFLFCHNPVCQRMQLTCRRFQNLLQVQSVNAKKVSTSYHVNNRPRHTLYLSIDRQEILSGGGSQ
jgi:hypothetical protein